MDTAIVSAWVEGYLKAWQTNDPQAIGDLFSADAQYYTSPFAEPWQGRDGIVQTWLAHADKPDDFTFRYEVLGTSEDSGIVRGWTTYKDPPKEYSNIWLVRFDDAGKCREFTEWWKEKPKK
jgi:uncharacterized protein (TIGR02246 family)